MKRIIAFTAMSIIGLMLTACGGGSDSVSTSSDTTAPVFSSTTVADDLIDNNITASTVVYDGTADNDNNVTYTLASGVGSNDLFSVASDGKITFKLITNTWTGAHGLTIIGAYNDYNISITATDAANNHTDHKVTLRVMNDVIDLGTTYGFLIAPVHVGGKWFYYWDRSGDGTIADTGSLNGGVDNTDHDAIDALFNHDINGTLNTTVANHDGTYGTTNVYRYGTINGIKLAVPTTGTGLENEPPMSNYHYDLIDGLLTYVDLANIWEIYNSGNQTSGTPEGWQDYGYLSATPGEYGHASVHLMNGSVFSGDDSTTEYVVLQVL